jgi:N-methylhydantoinase B/oxoprolinase/acetone carboxylase alpha subunit
MKNSFANLKSMNKSQDRISKLTNEVGKELTTQAIKQIIIKKGKEYSAYDIAELILTASENNEETAYKYLDGVKEVLDKLTIQIALVVIKNMCVPAEQFSFKENEEADMYPPGFFED